MKIYAKLKKANENFQLYRTNMKPKLEALTTDFESQLRGNYGDIPDAFQHIFEQAALTVTFGDEYARYVGDAHERDDKGMPGSIAKLASSQDLINNAWGRKLGNELKSQYGGEKWTDKKLTDFAQEVIGYMKNSLPEELGNKDINLSEGNITNLRKALNND